MIPIANNHMEGEDWDKDKIQILTSNWIYMGRNVETNLVSRGKLLYTLYF